MMVGEQILSNLLLNLLYYYNFNGDDIRWKCKNESAKTRVTCKQVFMGSTLAILIP